LDLVGATLENAVHGAVTPIAGIERTSAGAFQAFCSEAIDQTQNAVRLAQMVQRVVHEEFTNQPMGGWADRLGLAQAGLR
jgi:hypothetical protein